MYKRQVARHIEKLGGAPKLRTPDAVVFGEKGYVVEAMEYAQTFVREMCIRDSI